jgi:DNA-binding MarR family transcriptional regulator
MNMSANSSIERQLTILLRRGNRVSLSTRDGDVTLDRSAYGILCQLADEGPQRLGVLASVFQLDPSTITRQVQTLVERGLAVRESDPLDGRAYILDLTAAGREILTRTRRERRARLQHALEDWSEADLTGLARLLKDFNGSVDRLIAR